MKLATLVLGLSASLLSFSALAHPDGHDDMKPLAGTCADLAYPSRFEVDPAFPSIKALIATCEAASKPTGSTPTASSPAAQTAARRLAAQKAAARRAADRKAAARKAAAQKAAAKQAAVRKAAADS